MAVFNVHSGKKTIQEAVRRAGDALKPQYGAGHGHMLEGDVVNGDETVWRVTGLPYRAWCGVGDDA